MSGLFDQINSAVLGAFGKIATYTNVDGDSILVKVIFDRNFLGVDPGTGETVQSLRPMVHIKLADFYPLEPAQNDQIEVDGIQYYVDDVQLDSEGMAKLTLSKD